jgi:hypothetical protein
LRNVGAWWPSLQGRRKNVLTPPPQPHAAPHYCRRIGSPAISSRPCPAQHSRDKPATHLARHADAVAQCGDLSGGGICDVGGEPLVRLHHLAGQAADTGAGAQELQRRQGDMEQEAWSASRFAGPSAGVRRPDQASGMSQGPRTPVPARAARRRDISPTMFWPLQAPGHAAACLFSTRKKAGEPLGRTIVTPQRQARRDGRGTRCTPARCERQHDICCVCSRPALICAAVLHITAAEAAAQVTTSFWDGLHSGAHGTSAV